MNLRVPAEEELLLNTARLELVPLLPKHAEAMAEVLADDRLYTFLPQDPPSAETLRENYTRWAKRQSPAGDELWLNWMVQLAGKPIGHMQAGFRDPQNASIAYAIHPAYQRQGFAAEALEGVLAYLRGKLGARQVKAWVDTRNEASIALLKKLGFHEEARLSGADFFKGASSDEFIFARAL